MRSRALLVLLAVLAVVLVRPAYAEDQQQQQQQRRPKLKEEEHESIPPDLEVIDVPAAAVIDYGSASMRGRFGADGSLLTYMNFGVMQRLQFGASIAMNKFIGSAQPITLQQPELQMRWRFYDGAKRLPALAMGFDGQGYFYDRADRRYREHSRGFYIVGSMETGLPGLMVHPGFNISDFDTDAVFGFIGSSFNIEDRLLLLAEWDNIRQFGVSRLNLGMRFFMTSYFDATFSVREIGSGMTERLVMLRYVGNF